MYTFLYCCTVTFIDDCSGNLYMNKFDLIDLITVHAGQVVSYILHYRLFRYCDVIMQNNKNGYANCIVSSYISYFVLYYVQTFSFVLILRLHLLMMTAESMLSKRPVLGFIMALFFLLNLFSSHINCIP